MEKSNSNNEKAFIVGEDTQSTKSLIQAMIKKYEAKQRIRFYTYDQGINTLREVVEDLKEIERSL